MQGVQLEHDPQLEDLLEVPLRDIGDKGSLPWERDISPSASIRLSASRTGERLRPSASPISTSAIGDPSGNSPDKIPL